MAHIPREAAVSVGQPWVETDAIRYSEDQVDGIAASLEVSKYDLSDEAATAGVLGEVIVVRRRLMGLGKPQTTYEFWNEDAVWASFNYIGMLTTNRYIPIYPR